MRPLVRLSLRRYIHSLPHVAPLRRKHDNTKLAIGASLAVAGYVSWRIAGNDQRIALDVAPQRISQRADAASDTPREPDASAPSGPPIKVERERIDPPAEAEGRNAPEEAAERTEAEEEEGEGAFNPVTGEINWDCPCLGGMAHGPCGEQFRQAFSCFVFSEKEPKGIDCVEKFKNMQDCFREHPDVYGEEIADDEDDAPELSPAEGDTSSQPEFPLQQSEPISATPLSENVTRTSNTSMPPERH